MKIGIIADVHGNFEALKTVMGELAREKVDRLINAGDNIGYSPYPNECIKVLKSDGIYNIMGNYDDSVGNKREDSGCPEGDVESRRLRLASLRWTYFHTDSDYRKYLAALPKTLRFNLAGKVFFAMHGGLGSLCESIQERDTGPLANIADVLVADVVVMGHTHRPFVRHVKGKTFINPGSVGKPADGDPRASYAVVEIGDEVKVDFKRVEYDVEKAARDLESSGLPMEIGNLLRKGVETVSGWIPPVYHLINKGAY